MLNYREYQRVSHLKSKFARQLDFTYDTSNDYYAFFPPACIGCIAISQDWMSYTLRCVRTSLKREMKK